MPGLKDCHAIVLAAGKGTRMGGPKALMEVAGRPWWQHQHERLTRLGLGGVTWVVSPVVRRAMTDAGGGELRTVLADPESPMFASVLAGLRSLEAAAGPRKVPPHPASVFVQPVDCPVPSRGVWESLAVADVATIPTFRDISGHPVHLPWATVESVLHRVLRSNADSGTGELRLDRLLEGVAEFVPVEDPCVRVNLNTPRDVEAWLADPSGTLRGTGPDGRGP